MIYLCARMKDFEGAYGLIGDLQQMNLTPTASMYNAILAGYLREVIFDKRIPVKNLNEIKSVLVGALATNGQLSCALKVYEEMKGAECDLGPKAIKNLIEHFQSEGELKQSLQLLEEIEDSPYWTDACFRIISHCIQHENLRSTVDLLKQLKDKFIDAEVALEVLFDEVFCLFAEQEPRDMQFGLSLLQAIKEEVGIRPSRKSLDFLLSACVITKDSKASFLIWKEYETAGLQYNVLSLLRMYQALLASGERKSAEKLLNKMPKDDRHVRCVIQACQQTYAKTGSPSQSAKRRRKKKKKINDTV